MVFNRSRLLFGELIFRGAKFHHVLQHGQVEFQVVAAILGEITRDDIAAEVAEAALDRNHVS